MSHNRWFNPIAAWNRSRLNELDVERCCKYWTVPLQPDADSNLTALAGCFCDTPEDGEDEAALYVKQYYRRDDKADDELLKDWL